VATRNAFSSHFQWERYTRRRGSTWRGFNQMFLTHVSLAPYLYKKRGNTYKNLQKFSSPSGTSKLHCRVPSILKVLWCSVVLFLKFKFWFKLDEIRLSVAGAVCYDIVRSEFPVVVQRTEHSKRSVAAICFGQCKGQERAKPLDGLAETSIFRCVTLRQWSGWSSPLLQRRKSH